MKDFMFKMPTRIMYGTGAAEKIGDTLKGMGYKKIFIVTGPTVGKTEGVLQIKKSLENAGMDYEVYSNLAAEPSVNQIDEASAVLKASNSDAVLAVGGGSRIDAAKAMCLMQTHDGSIADYLFGGSKTVTNPTMPLICVPTTAGSGSEMTPVSVVNDEARGVKVSVTHDYLFPALAVIDPKLHVDMPKFVTGTTGMDALTHAIESYVSLNAGPLSDMMGLYAIKLIGENLIKAINDGADLEARGKMALASSIAGVAFMNGGLGVVHGIAQTMGAVADVPHGVANSLILPYAMKKNIKGNIRKFKDIAIALGVDESGLAEEEIAAKSAEVVFKLAEDAGIPMKLKEVGITREMFPDLVEGTMAYRLLALNPVKITSDDVLEILEEAFE